jgi:hypothetical protein
MYGLLVVEIHPVDEAVGAGAVHGNANTCHEVPLPTFVHPNETELDDKPSVVNKTGFGQAGGGPQVMLLTHPAALTVALDVNTKVKDPSIALEVIDGGMVVPEKAPIKLAAETTVPL